MKKLTSILLSSVLVMSMSAISAISASAEVTEIPADWDPTAYEYIVVGNEGLLGSNAWDPTNEAFKMNYDETTGIWYLNLNGIANEGEVFDFYSSPQYKVVVAGYNPDNAWEFSFNENGVAYGLDSNSMVDFGDTAETAEVVTITFNGEKTSCVIDSPYTEAPVWEQDIYYLTGSAPLFDPAWSPNHYVMCLENNREHIIEMPVTEDMWDSDIEYKVTKNGTWDVSYNEQGEAVGENSNAKLYIAENTVSIKFVFSEESKCVTAYPVYNSDGPVEEPTEEPTEAPTDEATETPTAESTEGATDESTVAPTQAPTNATNPTTSSTNATSAPTSSSSNSSTSNSSSATGKVATGDSTSVALLIGMLMLAGVGVVVAKKRIAE